MAKTKVENSVCGLKAARTLRAADGNAGCFNTVPLRDSATPAPSPRPGLRTQQKGVCQKAQKEKKEASKVLFKLETTPKFRCPSGVSYRADAIGTWGQENAHWQRFYREVACRKCSGRRVCPGW